MSNTRIFVMAMTGIILAAATATPAAACADWGYSGIFTYGWPYASRGVSNPVAYPYRSCGGIYNIPGWGECGGYGRCGWAPFPPVVMTVPVTDMALNAPAVGAAGGRRAVSRAARKARAHAAPAGTTSTLHAGGMLNDN